MAKTFLATQAQAQDIQNTVDEINVKITPVDLSNVTPLVLDFINDDITIISGGLDTYSRTISN